MNKIITNNRITEIYIYYFVQSWEKNSFHSPGWEVFQQNTIPSIFNFIDIGTHHKLLRRFLRTAERIGTNIWSRSIRIRGERLGHFVRLHHAEGRVLIEMWTEVESTVYTAFIPGGDEWTSLNHVVQAIEARGRKIFVVRVHLEAGQSTEEVFSPFPRIPKHIIKTLIFQIN